MKEILELIKYAQGKISSTENSNDLADLRIELTGKKSKLAQLGQKMRELTVSERPKFGAQLNQAKSEIIQLISEKAQQIESRELNSRLMSEKLDVTIPAIMPPAGSLHPITRVWHSLAEIFTSLGFSIASGPDIETQWMNFDALNIKPSHPARQMHDSFYMRGDDMMLRTHTSPVQIRTLSALQNKSDVDVRFISPGKTYRADSDQTHTPMFHQIELVYIAKDASIAGMKYLIKHFITKFFDDPDIEFRFRPSYFPFTEPSMEVDIKICRKNKKDSGWLEVLGCGMIHPQVMRSCAIDATRNRGFAFGAGIERLAMLKYNIKDLRAFFTSQAPWLRHYCAKHYEI